MSFSLDDTRYLQLAEHALGLIETAADTADLDTKRDGSVLKIELDSGDAVVINLQQPTHQVWLAARTGAHHYVWNGDAWCDTRSEETLAQAVARVMAALGGPELDLGDLR